METNDMNKSPDISIIIVTYNTQSLTMQCLQSLYKTVWKDISKEIIVVDNASIDATAEKIAETFPDVILIRNSKNLGFAAGNNIGIKKARGTYILLLNSDTEVEKESIPKMITFMEEHPKAGVSTCAVLLSNGSLDPASHRGFPTPWAAFSYMTGLERLLPKSHLFGGYHLGYKDMNTAHTIDCPSGAFFLVRKEVIAQVGLLDEDFFMYGEDIDWAYRIKEKGWEVWFNPSISILHLKKQSGRSHKDKEVRKIIQNYFLSTMRLFYKKHYEKKYGWFITQIVYIAIDIKTMLTKITFL